MSEDKGNTDEKPVVVDLDTYSKNKTLPKNQDGEARFKVIGDEGLRGKKGGGWLTRHLEEQEAAKDPKKTR